MAASETSNAPPENETEPNDFPWLARFFDAKTRHELCEEDREAMTNVCILLLAIVTMGVMLGVIGVFFATQF